MRILGISLGHDSNISIIENGKVKFVLEAERFFRQKRYKLHCLKLEEGVYQNGYQFCDTKDLKIILLYIKKDYGSNYDYVAVQNQKREEEFHNLNKILKDLGFNFKGIENFNHHLCHASSCYFTSPFSNSLILSYDGAGNDGNFIFFKAKDNTIEYLDIKSIKFGNAYNNMGYIGNIKPDVSGTGAGKAMGITSYGKIIEEWIPIIKKSILDYSKAPRKQVNGLTSYGVIHGIQWRHLNRIKELRPYMKGLDSSLTVKDEIYQNFAKTFQVSWSELVLEFILKHKDISDNICVSGGCALNGVTNYLIEKTQNFKRCHFIPNSSDCGLSVGAALLSYYKNSKRSFNGYGEYFSPYVGPEVFDKDNLENLKLSYNFEEINEELTSERLADLICNDKIIGVIRGGCEIGPRALGNRSILCNCKNKNMREIINDKVKHREWFRPFAPICIEEESKEYFSNDNPIPYMSVICYTKEEFRETLPSVTHVDGSARLQTVSKQQNSFIHETLLKIKDKIGFPICLNTSFNPGGEPILNYYHVGLQMLNDTDLDYVLIENTLFWKK